MTLIHDAVKRDVIVVIKTQCHHGMVSDVYATGRYLVNMGCILAQDMTTECLFAKLSYLIGKVSRYPNFISELTQCFNFAGLCNIKDQTADEDKLER